MRKPTGDVMKRLYTIVTPTHQSLCDEWFLPSLQDEFLIEARRVGQIGSETEHRCGTVSFNRTMVEKARLILEAIEENTDRVFIYSDVDVQFFAPTEQIIDGVMDGYDVACQLDAPLTMGRDVHPDFSGHLCAGFLVCRANERTHALWRDIVRYVEDRPDRHDQHALNELLNGLTGKEIGNAYGVRWRYLPPCFFGPGPQLGRTWEPGQPVKVPQGTVMHHANWTIGVVNKLAQLRAVREIKRRAA
jgi:hypothetical protein